MTWGNNLEAEIADLKVALTAAEARIAELECIVEQVARIERGRTRDHMREIKEMRARIAEMEREREGHVETCVQLNKQLRKFAARIAELPPAEESGR